MSDDAALLRRYAEERSESAFTEFVRRHLDLVYSAALRRCGGDPHRAAEVAQQVFTALARQAPALAHHAVLTAWLYTATRNHALNLLRAESRRQAHERDAHLMHTLFAGSAPSADWEKIRPALDEVMDELADIDRTAVLLRFFEQRSFSEVGAALHLTEDAARMRVERALDKLHLLLTRRGIVSTAAALAVLLANEAVGAAPAGLAASVAATALRAATGGAVALRFAAALKKLVLTEAAAGVGVAAVCTLSATIFFKHREAAISRSPRPLIKMTDSSHQPTALVSGPASATTPAEVNRIKAIERALSTNPLLQQLYADRSRLNIRVNYQSWFRRLRWSQAQIDAFADFVFDYARQLPAQPNYQPEPDMAADPAFAAAVRARFGNAIAEGFAHGQHTIVERRIVESLFGSLGAEQPLTPEQADELIEILAAAHPPMHQLIPQFHAERPSSPGFSDPLTALKPWGNYLEAMDWERVLARAETALAPAQTDLIRALAAKARASLQLRLAGGQTLSPETIIARDEKEMAAFCRDFRAGLDFELVRVQRVAGLAEWQVEKLKGLKMRALQRTIAQRAAVENGRLDAAEARATARSAVEEQAKEEAEILGDRVESFREFSRTLATRRYVERLAAEELYGEAPLGGPQIERTIEILVANSERRPNGSIISAAVTWDVASSQLRAVLLPRQIAVLQQFCRMTLLDHQVDEMIDRVIVQSTAAPPR